MRPRLTALLVAVLAGLALAACEGGVADGDEVVDTLDELHDAVGEATAPPDGGVGGEPDDTPPPEAEAAPADHDEDADTAAERPGEQPQGTPGDAADDGDEVPAEDDADAAPPLVIDDHAGVGEMGPALLRGDVPALTVEVLVQDGISSDRGALDHLQRVITREVDKPGGLRRTQHGFSSPRTRWSAADLRALAAERRQHRSSSDQAAIVVMYVRGEFEQRDAIGVALNATEIAVFPDRWRDLVGGVLGAAGNVERSVLVHEVGHLFGLVELTYASIYDRHDDDNPGHSRSRGSVMYWAIADTAVAQVFDGPPPDDFDRADRHDLRFLRSGRW